MTAAESGKLDSAFVAEFYREHGEALRRFALGLLGDASLAQDVLQSAFARFAEQGHVAEPQKRRAWLFRVAYNEAMLLRRRGRAGQRALEAAAWSRAAEVVPERDGLVRAETVQRVRQAIERLPPEQQQVIRLRIYEEKTFAAIAQQLDIPLGTALARMRSALQKLRPALAHDWEDECHR